MHCATQGEGKTRISLYSGKGAVLNFQAFQRGKSNCSSLIASEMHLLGPHRHLGVQSLTYCERSFDGLQVSFSFPLVHIGSFLGGF